MLIRQILWTVLLTMTACALAHAERWIDRGHGRVTMNGQIQASACSIRTDDVWQEVVFDTLSPAVMVNGGAESVREFSLHLVNCRLEKEKGGEWKSVAVTFAGEPVDGHPELFAVSGDARGMALAVSDKQGNSAQPGVAMEDIPLNEEGNALDYRLQVVPTGAVFEEGAWSGTIRFMVAYQ